MLLMKVRKHIEDRVRVAVELRCSREFNSHAQGSELLLQQQRRRLLTSGASA